MTHPGTPGARPPDGGEPEGSYVDLEEPHPAAGGRRGFTPQQVRFRRRRVLGGLTLLAAVLAVTVAGWFAWQGLRPVLDDIGAFSFGEAAEDYPGPGSGSAEVVIAQGDSGAEMATTLTEAGVVASREAFLAAANVEPDFTSIQPGTYLLRQEMSAFGAVEALLDPVNRRNDVVVIPEGLRTDQILDRLAEGTGIDRAELDAALAAAELPAAAQGNPEGFLYPDGYQFRLDATAEEVVRTLLDRNQEVLAELGVPPERQLEVLTKASLVQGEARLPEDFGKVARVVENRLQIGQPLQLDSTVNYATQTFDTRTTPEQRDVDSPYNTYRYPGLPPGPIKSPGRQALEAVLAPTPGPWLYFVAVDLDTGETLFTDDYDEHLGNVEQLNQWQRENSGG